MRIEFRSPTLVGILLLCSLSLFFVITQRHRVEEAQTALEKAQTEHRQLAEAEHQFEQYADYHEHWRQRGLFLPVPNKVFSEWLQAWAATTNHINLKTPHRTFIKASLDITNPPSSSSQGMMAVEIESLFEPITFALLHSLIDQAPALLQISACEWSKQEGTHQYNLKTRCRLHWQRFPLATSIEPLSEQSIYFPPPHKQTSLGQISSRLIPGKLIWAPLQRFSPPPVTVPTLNSSDPASLPHSHGWIKRSDGMELQWPKH